MGYIRSGPLSYIYGLGNVKPLVLLYKSHIVYNSIIKAFYYKVLNLVLDYGLKLTL